MNIGQMLRSIVGDLQVADAKALELKVGQVVRGVILQMMSDQDAMVNINGVQVRAKLEIPMAQGQTTLLQVQPESVSGQVVLKPLDSSGVQIAEKSLPELLSQFEIKDTPSNRRALQELHHSETPLTKDTAKAYTDVLSERPEGVEEGQWKEAALLAVKRGLPVTQESVGSLRQTMFGRPMDQALQALGNQVSELLNREGTALSLSPSSRNLLGQIRQVLDTLPQMPVLEDEQGGETSASALTGAGSARAKPEGAGRTAAEGSRTGASAGTIAEQDGQPQAPRTAEGAWRPGGRPGGDEPAPAAPRGAVAGGADAAGAGARALPPAGGDAAVPPASRGSSAANGAAAAKPSPPQAPDAGGAAAGDAHAPEEPTPWVGRLLKALGVEHEQQLARALDRDGLLPSRNTAADGSAMSAPNAAPQPADAEAAKTADTLKGLLLQLSAADDAPSALKEGAQQLVQHITGQQLLLTQDRTSMFSHMTLMLPLMNSSGDQTAAVHIQSRRGAKGELDASNCRLLFDLNMQSLGNTLVDVQVTDRIVGLRVHNDFPVIGELLEAHRDEIKAGLESVGYQFLSMKVLPYPDLNAAAATLSRQGESTSSALTATRAANLYHTKPYKGVDVRV